MPQNIYSDITSDLIAFAQTGDHTTFRYLRNFPDYLFIRKTKRALRAFLDNLQLRAYELFDNYCDKVTCGNSQVEELLTYKALHEIIDFYEDEYLITLGVLQEFEAYMKSGHFIDMIFFGEREDQDLWDHRGE